MDKQDFPAAKLRQRYRLTVCNSGQGEVWVDLTNTGRITVGVGWCGKKESASQNHHQQAQVSHGPVPLNKFVFVDLQRLIYNHSLFGE